jgi:glutaredoxin
MFTVYSKPNCQYCDKAKALLLAKDLPFEIIHLDVGQQKDDAVQYITKDELLQIIPTARTMPQITKASVYVGGYTELAKLLG